MTEKFPRGKTAIVGSATFGCGEPGCITTEATESAAVLEALALAMNSRAESEETSAAMIASTAPPTAPAKIREV